MSAPSTSRPGRRRTTMLLSAGIACLALAGGATFAAVKGQTVWDGVYSEAQATSGASRYAQQCARCHGPELYGTAEIPSLRGQLIARFGNAPLSALSAYINHAMPMQSPGALPPATNAEILAFILKTNGAPAGPTPLSADPAALTTIAMTAKPVGMRAGE